MTATKKLRQHPKPPTRSALARPIGSALSVRLRQACKGHPHAKIPWPHRLLHEAADEIERLQSIIHRASVKFCEDGSDGKIAAEMFAILGEKNTPNNKVSGWCPPSPTKET